MGHEQIVTSEIIPTHIKEKVNGTNINPQTLLATDYLNHFNEIVMLLEMVPDMPDILEDCKEWAPKSYCQHFKDSSLSDGEIAVEVYDHVPERFKAPFEKNINQLNHLIAESVSRLQMAIEMDDNERLQNWAHISVRSIQGFMDVCNAIIHGSEETMHQEDVDDIFAV